MRHIVSHCLILYAATDNHVGYKEKDPVRCNDSLESFEEILKVAKNQAVGFSDY